MDVFLVEAALCCFKRQGFNTKTSYNSWPIGFATRETAIALLQKFSCFLFSDTGYYFLEHSSFKKDYFNLNFRSVSTN